MTERGIIMSGPMVRAILEDRKLVTRRVVNMERLRLRGRRRVTADWPGLLDPKGDLLVETGKLYRAHIARLGAVSAVMSNGKGLGLKPGEFDFRCPYLSGGRTQLINGGRRPKDQTWQILPMEPNRLYVRETWATGACADGLKPSELSARFWKLDNGGLWYRADGAEPTHPVTPRGPWRPPRFMPKWAARVWLEITEVAVERVQEITEQDAIAEGLRQQPGAPDQGYNWRGVGYEGSKPGYFHVPGDSGCRCKLAGPTAAQCAFRDGWDSLNAKRGFSWESNPWVWVVRFRRTEAPRG